MGSFRLRRSRLLGLLITVAVMTAACGSSEGVDTTLGADPTTAAAAAATTVVEPTTTTISDTTTTEAPLPPTTLSAEETWDQIPVSIGPDGGEFRTREFSIPMRFTVPRGWGRVDPEASHVLVLGPPCPGQPCDVIILVTDERATDEVVAEIVSIEGIETTDPQESNIGGAPGVTLDVTAAQGVDQVKLYDIAGGPGIFMFPDMTVSVSVVDVSGDTLIIFIIYTGAFVSTEELQGVVGSFVWQSLQ